MQHIWKIGRIGTHRLKCIQYSWGRDATEQVNEDELADLRFLGQLVAVLPPRLVPLRAGVRRYRVGYTDAEYSRNRSPRIGAVLYRGAPFRPLGLTALLGPSITDEWVEREQQIYLAELFAIPILLCQCRAQLTDSDLLLFVDNESAVAAVIRGVTKAPDARIIIETIHILQLRMNLRIWVEWIDSKSNPADGFSREGLSCEFAQ